MSDALIVRRGGSGGLSANKAVIHVTAPAGSTITFSKGGVIVKTLGPEKSHVNARDNTLAEWYYAVGSSNYGTWTVTATLGTNSSSNTIIIDSNKQYDAILRYSWTLLPRDGIQWTSSYNSPGSAAPSNSYANGKLNLDFKWGSGSGYSQFRSSEISLVGYNTIELHYSMNLAGGGSGVTFRFGAASQSNLTVENTSAYQKSISVASTSGATLTADISGLSDLDTAYFYVGFQKNSANVTAVVDSIILRA